MAKLIIKLSLLICTFQHSFGFARVVEGEITTLHVAGTNRVTVKILVNATSNQSDQYMSITGGYTLECPTSPPESYSHEKGTEASAELGNQISWGILPLGNHTDGNTYSSGYPMTRAWEQVRNTNKPIQCKIQLKSKAGFGSNQVGFNLSGFGFQYNVSFSGAISEKQEIISELVTINPPQSTGGGGEPCIAYCTEFDPLLIDLNQDGINLGPAERGVWFDMLMLGSPQHMQWVAINGDEAFLAYDLNGNGVVDNGSELFGNGTLIRVLSRLKQGKALKKTLAEAGELASNGFVALAQFDTPRLGGNNDGFISNQDTIWHSLSLWLDTNADGYSTINEMFSLNDAGINKLEVIPKHSHRLDPSGNRIPLWSWSYNNQSTGNRKHKMVDVFFKGL